MAEKIQSSSNGNDAGYRRDFKTNENVDKYGNKVVKDFVGNSKLIISGQDTPDFSYQKKYSLENKIDKFGDNKVYASVFDDAFIETLINSTKMSLDEGVIKKIQKLSDGSFSSKVQEEKISENGIKSLEKIINLYNQYINKSENTTIKTIIDEDTNQCDHDREKMFEEFLETMNLTIDDIKTKSDNKYKCNKCQVEVTDGAKFCHNCGKELLFCFNCNFQVNKNDNFCNNCGSKLG